MAKPGAQIPRYSKEHTIGVDQENGKVSMTCHSFRITVSSPGSLYATMIGTPDEIVELHYPATGVYIEPGEFQELWLAEAPPTTVPAETVILYNT